MSDYNIIGMEATPLHSEMARLMRKVKRTELQTEKYVESIQNKSELHLKELEYMLNQQDQYEEEHQSLLELCKENQMQFVFDLDTQLTKEGQELALIRQTEQHKKDMLPHWIKQYDEISNFIKAYGHNNKLRWRSKVVSAIHKCNEEIIKNPNLLTSTINNVESKENVEFKPDIRGLQIKRVLERIVLNINTGNIYITTLYIWIIFIMYKYSECKYVIKEIT